MTIDPQLIINILFYELCDTIIVKPIGKYWRGIIPKLEWKYSFPNVIEKLER